MPKEIGFDTAFMLEVLKGKKKYLPISVSSGYELPYFKTGETLNKNYIIEKMGNNNEYKDYIPDGVSLNKLSRKFLLSVSKNINNFK
jgi:hypothetical protein